MSRFVLRTVRSTLLTYESNHTIRDARSPAGRSTTGSNATDPGR